MPFSSTHYCSVTTLDVDGQCIRSIVRDQVSDSTMSIRVRPLSVTISRLGRSWSSFDRSHCLWRAQHPWSWSTIWEQCVWAVNWCCCAQMSSVLTNGQKGRIRKSLVALSLSLETTFATWCQPWCCLIHWYRQKLYNGSVFKLTTLSQGFDKHNICTMAVIWPHNRSLSLWTYSTVWSLCWTVFKCVVAKCDTGEFRPGFFAMFASIWDSALNVISNSGTNQQRSF